MAFRRSAPTPNVAPVRSGLHASAQRVSLKGRKIDIGAPAEWQEEAWGYFDAVGEVKQLCWLQGNVMAKMKLFVGVRDPDDPDAAPVPVTDPDSGISPDVAKRAQAELDRLKGPLGGKSEIVRELNMNLEIAGMAYLIGRSARTETVDGVETEFPEEWAIYSVSEVRKEGSGKGATVKVVTGPNDAKGWVLNKETDTIITIWQRHPRWSMQADCALRGALSELETLVALRNQVKASARSKIPAGWVTMPNEISFGPVVPTEGEDGEEAANDPFEAELIDSLIEPIEDPGSASAYAPTILRGPGEMLSDQFIRRITFERADDPKLQERIDGCIQGLARALNAPVEKVLGSQQTTFANAAVIKQDEFDEHLEPRCVLVCDALTVAFLQPNLADTAPDEQGAPTVTAVNPDIVARLCVWYDPSAMIAQPDLAEKVEWAVENDLLSWEAGRRIIGASEDDAPSDEEMLLKMVFKIRTLDPGISTSIIELLDVPLDIPKELPGTTASAASVERILAGALAQKRAGQPVNLKALMAEMRSPRAEPILAALPSPKTASRNPGRHLMTIDRELRSKLQTAASAALTRALERAGQKLRAKNSQTQQLAKGVNPLHVGRLLGPQLVAAAGFSDDDLIPADAWDSLEEQFLTWGAQAQTQALDAVNKLVGLTASERDTLGLRQADDLGEAWDWMRDQLHDLAKAKLYDPDPHAPDLGEFDPTSKVPSGLVRQAITRAGGATGLTVQGSNPYVVLNNGQPPGGIGTGETVMTALTGSDVLVEGYEWVYGPAFRQTPFDPHLDLDGEPFTDWSSDVLSGSFLDDDNWFPGDHQGCCCDASPVLIAREDLENGE